MREPTPPEGVRLHYQDGSSQPVECSYQGRRWLTHRWRVTVIPDIRGFQGLSVTMLPARSMIELYVDIPGAHPPESVE